MTSTLRCPRQRSGFTDFGLVAVLTSDAALGFGAAQPEMWLRTCTAGAPGMPILGVNHLAVARSSG